MLQWRDNVITSEQAKGTEKMIVHRLIEVVPATTSPHPPLRGFCSSSKWLACVFVLFFYSCLFCFVHLPYFHPPIQTILQSQFLSTHAFPTFSLEQTYIQQWQQLPFVYRLLGFLYMHTFELTFSHLWAYGPRFKLLQAEIGFWSSSSPGYICNSLTNLYAEDHFWSSSLTNMERCNQIVFANYLSFLSLLKFFLSVYLFKKCLSLCSNCFMVENEKEQVLQKYIQVVKDI